MYGQVKEVEKEVRGCVPGISESMLNGWNDEMVDVVGPGGIWVCGM
jgi:hypothetical protein